MKKIILSYDFLSEIGGLERVMFFFANELSKKYDIELLFCHINQEKKDEILKNFDLNKNIKISCLNKGENQTINLIKSFLNPYKINKVKADLIFSHSFLTAKMAKIYKEKNDTPYLIIMHHPPNFLYSPVNFKQWINNPSRLLAFFLGFFLKKKLRNEDNNNVENAKLVLISSKHTIDRVKNIYYRNGRLLYPPVSRFFKIIEEKEAKKILENKNINYPFILFHGRIIPDKRPDLFLEIVKRLENYKLNGKDINFVVSGDLSKEMNNYIKNEIKNKKIRNIKILGKVSKDELRALYNSAKLLIVTAQKEDFGLTLIESMACGTPVVAWNDHAGPSETIINNKNGFLTEAYNLNNFIDKIKYSLERKWDKKKIKKTVDKFSEKDVSKRLNFLINKIQF